MLKQFQEFLKSLDNKTGFIAVLLLIVSVLVGVVDSEGQTTISTQAVAWIGFISGVLLVLFKALAPSGSLTKGEKAIFYVTQSLLAVMQVGQIIQANDTGLFDDKFVAAVTQIQFWLAAAFAALQATKNGGTGTPAVR